MVTESVNVLFRVDAGPHTGLGHLQRCLSLATALRHFGASCFFLIHEEQAACERVRHSEFHCTTLGIRAWSEDDLAQTISAAASNRCTVIVVDSDEEVPEYLDHLRKAGIFVCAIDDNALHPFPCQWVVNGNAHARQLPYRASGGNTFFLLGPEYSLLRREFWNRSDSVVRPVVQNILITVGGADPFNLMPGLVKLLGELPGTFTITSLIGPFFNNLDEVKSTASAVLHPVRLVYSPDLVCGLMREADLAVSAAGQTLYELACVGCPTVAIGTAANQDRQLEQFNGSGFVRVAGRADEHRIFTSVGDAVLSLLPDAEARASMSVSGRRLVDGQGALRVARVMMEYQFDNQMDCNVDRRHSTAVKNKNESGNALA